MYFKLAGLHTASLDWRVGLITLVSCQIQKVARVPPVEKSSNNACYLFIYLFIYLYYPFTYFGYLLLVAQNKASNGRFICEK